MKRLLVALCILFICISSLGASTRTETTDFSLGANAGMLGIQATGSYRTLTMAAGVTWFNGVNPHLSLYGYYPFRVSTNWELGPGARADFAGDSDYWYILFGPMVSCDYRMAGRLVISASTSFSVYGFSFEKATGDWENGFRFKGEQILNSLLLTTSIGIKYRI